MRGIALDMKLRLIIIALAIATAIAVPKDEYTTGRKLISDNPGFISIDCGSPKAYLYDGTPNIWYDTDDGFISSGRNMEISSVAKSRVSYIQQAMNVRSFDQGLKNCYSLPLNQTRDRRILIRATFMYGNYDGKNAIPKFDLYIGVNFWTTVELPEELSFRYDEIIHLPTTDAIHVCLVNTGNGTPFISGLEIRMLETSMYSELEAPLVTGSHFYAGANTSLRYNDDAYDRIWEFFNSSKWERIETNAAIDIQFSNIGDRPPAKVFSTAIKPVRDGDGLYYYFDPSGPNSQVYAYLHFAEIEELPNGTQRALNVHLNGQPHPENPILLEYLKPRTVTPTISMPMQGERVTISINTTLESDLPPILNAIEIFELADFSRLPTHQEDVDAIMEIKMKVTKDWQGDPCLPINCTWDGLKCSIEDSPRIISLNLSSSGLNGNIFDTISSLRSLKSLDLSYNNLTGHVPGFLGELPNLTSLNLSHNNLIGIIPEGLQAKAEDGSLLLSMDGNPNLCLKDRCDKKKKKIELVPIFVPIISVLVLLLICLSVVFWTLRRKIKPKMAVVESGSEGSVKSKKRKFTYSEIVRMTNNFEIIAGKGGSGIVYYGFLAENNTNVAIKMMYPSSAQLKQFHTEVQLLMRIHHRNLTSLMGYCDDAAHIALIYEYMVNGDLQKHLLGKASCVLSWKERLQIAVDAAQGLEYLHNGCKPPIVHRDMKTANILLNEKLQAKISDFGVSRIFATESTTHVSTGIAGTHGYLDPEYNTTFRLTEKSDVYSFGIVLLELITGQPAIIKDIGSVHIVTWVKSMISMGDIQSIVDPRLSGNFSANSAWRALETAMECVPSVGIQRPNMCLVVTQLKECLDMEITHERSWGITDANCKGKQTLLSLGLPRVDEEFESAPQAR